MEKNDYMKRSFCATKNNEPMWKRKNCIYMDKQYMKSKTDEKCEEKKVQSITITKKKEQLCSVCRFFTFPYYYYWIKNRFQICRKKSNTYSNLHQA